MLISTSKRFIFVANTKTASTAIEHVLAPHAEFHYRGDPRRKHLALSAVTSVAPEIFADPQYRFASFFKFGVMREPIEWITSWYRYRLGNTVESPLPADLSFEGFWRRQDWNIRRKDGRKFLQSSMFTDDSGACLADVILPYDGMAHCAARVFGHLGISAPLPRKNVSRIRETGAPISADLRSEMREYYAADYALYDRLEALNALGMERLHHMNPH